MSKINIFGLYSFDGFPVIVPLLRNWENNHRKNFIELARDYYQSPRTGNTPYDAIIITDRDAAICLIYSTKDLYQVKPHI